MTGKQTDCCCCLCRGYFSISDQVKPDDKGHYPDTYMSIGGGKWSKGVAFVNGFNLVWPMCLCDRCAHLTLTPVFRRSRLELMSAQSLLKRFAEGASVPTLQKIDIIARIRPVWDCSKKVLSSCCDELLPCWPVLQKPWHRPSLTVCSWGESMCKSGRYSSQW